MFGINKIARISSAVVLFGLLLGMVQNAQAAEPACRIGPLVKNLTGLTARPCANQVAATPQQLTKKEVNRLTATAKTAEDHSKLAAYHKAEADRLDAKAAEYEEIAAGLRQNPAPKNLVAPGTAARYDYFAKGFREEANPHRDLEEHCDQLVASLRLTAN